ncbi:MAG: glycosyltransferase family 9 protein [Armatimonadota bacterium]|nr:glycosyltransferase family 9 protein [Armatimonadota bacterium]
MENPKSILIVKLSAIGDVVMATHTAELIRTTYPNAYVAWLVEDKCADAVVGNPFLDEVFVWRRLRCWADVGATVDLVRKLRARNFQFAIDLHGIARSSILARLSGARKRIGFAKGPELSSALYNIRVDCSKKRPAMDRHLALMEVIGINPSIAPLRPYFPLSDQDICDARRLLESVEINSEIEIAAFAPATTRDYKHWMENNWTELANELSSRFGLTPVFLGAPENVALIERIRTNTSVRTESFAGLTTLRLAAAVMKIARLTVTVDNGLMHTSVAIGTPTVAVFGPTSQWRNHSQRAHFMAVRKEFDCAPCSGKTVCDQFDCMRSVGVEDVVDAVARMLHTSGPVSSNQA